MITVAILINGEPIYTRSARNMGRKRGRKTMYKTDCGKTIWHDADTGCVPLAHQMLDTISPLIDR